MSELEKIIQDIEHLNTPTARFVEFVTRDKDYQKAKIDKLRWKEILKIYQQNIEVFNRGEYDDLRKIFKEQYPNR